MGNQICRFVPPKKGCIVCWEPLLLGDYCRCIHCRARMHHGCISYSNGVVFCPRCLRYKTIHYEKVVPVPYDDQLIVFRQ
jgi:hypothetical protein